MATLYTPFVNDWVGVYDQFPELSVVATPVAPPGEKIKLIVEPALAFPEKVGVVSVVFEPAVGDVRLRFSCPGVAASGVGVNAVGVAVGAVVKVTIVGVGLVGNVCDDPGMVKRKKSVPTKTPPCISPPAEFP